MNHLEGRTAGFFCYGDGGGDELDVEGRPKLLKHMHKHYFDPDNEPFENDRDSYAPLIWQCRYGGIEVPDELWHYVEFGKGEKYSDNQAEDLRRVHFMAEFQALLDFPPAPKLAWDGKLDPKKASPQELHGQEVFFGKAQCSSCHAPPHYTDNIMHDLLFCFRRNVQNVGLR